MSDLHPIPGCRRRQVRPQPDPTADQPSRFRVLDGRTGSLTLKEEALYVTDHPARPRGGP